MKLLNAQITPGIVKKIVDDFGTIKASVCGVFTENDSPDMLPPIYPFFTILHGTFSRPTVGEKIWVISTIDNPTQLLYFKQPELTEDIKNVIKETGSDQCEILSNYDGKNGWAQIFFSDGTGWMIRDDKVYINLTDDKMILSTGAKHRTISITDEGISFGTENESKEKAVLGDSLTKLLDNLKLNIDCLAKAASDFPYTAGLTPALTKMSQDLSTDIKSILSEHVTLD